MVGNVVEVALRAPAVGLLGAFDSPPGSPDSTGGIRSPLAHVGAYTGGPRRGAVSSSSALGLITHLHTCWRGPRSTWFQSTGSSVPSSIGPPPPTRRPSFVAKSIHDARTSFGLQASIRMSAPVAGHVRCVERSSGAAGLPESSNALCSAAERKPEIIETGIRVLNHITWAARIILSARSCEISHREDSPHASEIERASMRSGASGSATNWGLGARGSGPQICPQRQGS